MSNQKSNEDTTLNDVKKSIDRLTTIELIRAGATRSQVRDVMGTINNQAFSKIHQAMKKAPSEKDGEE